MKKRTITRLLGVGLLGLVSVLGLTSCKEEDVFNIQCWNDEFRVFFNRYASDEGKALIAQGQFMEKAAAQAKTGLHYKGVKVVWTETPNSDGQYQNNLDNVLSNNARAKKSKKVDMFLAEADYIVKYAGTSATQDITTLGTAVSLTNTYNYTVQAASDANGKVKGVSFQCCPSGLIYNRTIARMLWNTDDPAVVQTKLDTWEKYEAVAAQVYALDATNHKYVMTGSEADSYRVFSNNAASAWVTDNVVSRPAIIDSWMAQAERMVTAGYSLTSDVWGDKKTFSISDPDNYAQIVTDKTADAEKEGKTYSYDYSDQKVAFCTFGPAWYYNFCMGYAKKGDWGLVKGPQAHFWGGTWLLAATGTDNPDLVASVMNDFVNDRTICDYLISREGQFTNNKLANNAAALTASNEFLGGQNDTAIFVGLADDIVWRYATTFDQLCNEGFQKFFREYLEGSSTKAQALSNFNTYITGKYANLRTN